MKKWHKYLVWVLILLLFCSACQSPKRYALSTASTSGALYPLGAAMAHMWEEEGYEVVCEASAGGLDNLHLLRTQEVDMGFAVASIARDAYEGKGLFKEYEARNLRVLASLYANPNQLVATQDIKKISDLKDRRLAVGAPGSTTEIEAARHLEAAGIAYPQDIQVDAVGLSEATDLMRDRQTEAVWVMSGIPTAAVTEMTTSGDAHVVGIDDKVLAVLQKADPSVLSYTIPANTYGEHDAVPTTAVRMLLLTHQDIAEEDAYQLTKAFWTHLDELKESQKALEEVSLAGAIEGLGDIPLHKGAERYYKEQNLL